MLQATYGGWLKVTLTEPSSSIVVRSEQQYRNDGPHRTALRKHLYELDRSVAGEYGKTWTPYRLSDGVLRAIQREIETIRFKAQPPSGFLASIIDPLKALLRRTNGRELIFKPDGQDFVEALRNEGVVTSLHAVDKETETKFWRAIRRHSQSPFYCHHLYDKDEMGEYLGFIDLRPKSYKAPLAMGVLSPPRRYREDPGTFIITGQYGPFFGGRGFSCTVYSMVETELSGAACAQACIIMVLAILSDRGAQIRGSYSLTYLANSIEPPALPSSLSPAPTCIRNKAPFRPVGSFLVKGLPYKNCIDVLSKGCNVSPSDIDLKRSDEWLVLRLLQAYLYARYPVLLPVDAGRWWGDDSQEGHAVLVIGLRQTADDPANTSLIVHDPTVAPYREKRLFDCLEAVVAYFREPHKQRSAGEGRSLPRPADPYESVRLLAIADESVRTHAFECLEDMRRRFEQEWREAVSNGNLRIRLLDHQDIASTFLAANDPRKKKVEESLLGLPRGRYWCVALFAATSNLVCLCLYHAGECQSLGHCIVSGGEPTGALSGTSRVPSRYRPESPPPPGRVNPAPLGRLRPSILTSSSNRSLTDLMSEVYAINGVADFDLLMLRDTDIVDFVRSTHGEGALPSEYPSATALLREPHLCDQLAFWLADVLGGLRKRKVPVKCPALATYFPDISSMDNDRWKAAIEALAGTVNVGLHLKSLDFMDNVIVEMVCGTILDRCGCPECTPHPGQKRQRILEYSRTDKIDRLLKGLEGVFEIVGDRSFTLALELEPGETYVYGGGDPSDPCKWMCEIANRKKTTPKLDKHVALNLDIAHMKIAGIMPENLLPYREHFVHAHIADHPRMHTRDQVVGVWTAVECNWEAYGDYFKLLSDRAGHNHSLQPFSGAVALELEGCNRINWIHQSVAAMKFLCRTV